jgi:hypothetical protein
LTFNKPKPTIQKITFSKEDQENIDLLLAGRPTKKAAKLLQDLKEGELISIIG